MVAKAANDETSGHSATNKESVKNSSVLQDAQSLWDELRSLSYAHLRIAALETRRVGESLVFMIVVGVIVAVLLIVTWLGIMAIVVMKLIENGMVASDALSMGLACNLIVVLILASAMRYKSRFLQFPATLRSLRPKLSKQQKEEKS